MEKGTFGLGFEGQIGPLSMVMEDVRKMEMEKTNLKVMGWRKNNQRQGDSWGQQGNCFLDPRQYIKPEQGESSRGAIPGLSSGAPAP